MKHTYTHIDKESMPWRFDGMRPVSMIADIITEQATPIMTQFVIYEKPKDYPDRYVVRPWFIYEGYLLPLPGGQTWVCETLESARSHVSEGKVKMDRFRNDDPVIKEVWV